MLPYLKSQQNQLIYWIAYLTEIDLNTSTFAEAEGHAVECGGDWVRQIECFAWYIGTIEGRGFPIAQSKVSLGFPFVLVEDKNKQPTFGTPPSLSSLFYVCYYFLSFFLFFLLTVIVPCNSYHAYYYQS